MHRLCRELTKYMCSFLFVLRNYALTLVLLFYAKYALSKKSCTRNVRNKKAFLTRKEAYWAHRTRVTMKRNTGAIDLGVFFCVTVRKPDMVFKKRNWFIILKSRCLCCWDVLIVLEARQSSLKKNCHFRRSTEVWPFVIFCFHVQKVLFSITSEPNIPRGRGGLKSIKPHDQP